MTSIPKLLKLKDYITLCGTTLGIIAIICGLIGTRFYISLGFFLVSITLGTDLLDGYIARKTGTVNQFGIELDSLSDFLTFGVAPSILTFQAFRMGGFYDLVIMIGCIGFTLGAILRLARFNISTEEHGYTGVPTPLSCLVMIIFFYANYFYAFALGGLTYPLPLISYFLVPIIMICIGWFNITTHIKFKEKSKNTYIMVGILAPLCPILGVIGILNPNYLASIIISIFFFSCFLFCIFYFFIGFVRKRE